MTRHRGFVPSGFFDDELFNNVFSKADAPAVNIEENDNGYTLNFAVPGFDKADFSVDVHDHVLTVKGAHKASTEKTASKFTRREFSVKNFERSFQLPQNTVDVEAVKGNYENGILTISLPKQAELQPKKRSIAIA
jgi:HSP20 family protein